MAMAPTSADGKSVPFTVSLTGDAADYHQFHAYDGYTSLAGFAFTLSLITNYVETGVIRHRGDFPGRRAVRATALQPGSVTADFFVWLTPSFEVLGAAAAGAAGPFFYSFVRRIIARNVGAVEEIPDPVLADVLRRKSGDVEALVAVTEPSLRRTHDVIGRGAGELTVSGGFNLISRLDVNTKAYMTQHWDEGIPMSGHVTVNAFDANSGYGRIFDATLGRTIPVTMTRDLLNRYGPVFTWGMHQYMRKTGKKIEIEYTRTLAMDDTPKRYRVLSARRADD